MTVHLQPAISLFVEVSIIALQLFRESYLLLFGSTLIAVNSEQPAKASLPISVTELGIEMGVSLEHPSKAAFPISVMEFGRVIDFNPKHLSKAPLPIFITESGIVMDVSPVHL